MISQTRQQPAGASAQAHDPGVPAGDGLLAARIAQGVRGRPSLRPRRGWTRSIRARRPIPTGSRSSCSWRRPTGRWPTSCRPRIRAIRRSRQRVTRPASWPAGGSRVPGDNPGGSAHAAWRPFRAAWPVPDVEQKPAATTFRRGEDERHRSRCRKCRASEYFLKNVPERLEKETDAGVKEELRQQLATAEESVTRNREVAMENLLLAAAAGRCQDAAGRPESGAASAGLSPLHAGGLLRRGRAGRICRPDSFPDPPVPRRVPRLRWPRI